MPDAVKIDLTNTSEKFHIVVGEILPHLTEFLGKLCHLEDEYFVQSERLHRKGRVITFQNGVKKEITQYTEINFHSIFQNLTNLRRLKQTIQHYFRHRSFG